MNIDWQTYKNVILEFNQCHTDTMKHIWQAFRSKDWKSLRSHTYHLNGSSGAIGAYVLQKEAQLLEIACKADSLVQPNIMQVNRIEIALKRVMESIRTLGNYGKSAIPQQKPITKDDIVELTPVFQDLADSMVTADTEEIIYHMAVMRRYFTPVRLKNIEDLINVYDFESALNSLERLSESLGIQIQD